MSLLTWLFVGCVCGGLASIFRGEGPSPLRINLLLGSLGAVLAGIWVTPWFGIETINQKAFSLPSMFISLGGAILILVIALVVRRMTPQPK